ncbi:PREDICTED: uncharacterized protein LOC104738639 [Camelina sativa]|uniref:Uncharacterized protein LOC104738639 n=1 Tax=Camelina sativa TaxID=90675 RepID=A0ABM0VJB6_CAMSA|nr:PREDICTED: uncharacterized protein LOC104738639 [Camelina sativa]
MGDEKKDQKLSSYLKAKTFTHFSFYWLTSKLILLTLAILFSVQFVFYPLNLISSSYQPVGSLIKFSVSPVGSGSKPVPNPEQTDLKHVVFGIAASAKLWKHRRDYVKLWWKPNGEMNGVVWLDKHIAQNDNVSATLPPIKISSDTSRFKYKYPNGLRSAIRITRIVSETVRLLNGTESEKNVRWIVMGDDDTVFFPENLVKVLRKYDHKQFYYIGSPSESHIQNLKFSYGMAYGGGGFAISYPLAKALEKMQDRCIQRYSELYGSDDRIHACMSELGVPLTKEVGFHQIDLYGKLLGLLSAHPLAPLVSIHHLDLVDPVFPNMGRVNAMQRFMVSAKLDSASLAQQSICYDKARRWTVSVSWGYTVQIIRGVLSAKEMLIPTRTFIDWYKRAEEKSYAFNTRPFSKNACQRPRVYYLSNALPDLALHRTASEYVRWYDMWDPECDWHMSDPSEIERVIVYKKPDPDRWNRDRAPRRDCCRVLPTKKNGTMVIDVGACKDDEIVEFPVK